MSIPVWVLIALSVQELVLIAAFWVHKQWIDVVYWLGVQIVNVALIWRAYEQLK